MHMHITTKVIASVEKYENAGIKFSTVPAFALADSRASDACCLFLVQYEHLPVFSSPGKFRASCAFWLCRLTQRYSHPPRSILQVDPSGNDFLGFRLFASCSSTYLDSTRA